MLFGLVAISRVGVATDIQSNTAIRVLLDRAIPKGKVHSLLLSSYYRGNPSRGWIRSGKELDISLGYSPAFPIQVNSQPVNESFVFVRGGQSPSDKLRLQDGVFRGALKWTRKENSFSVVNYLGVEDYLLGTLGEEMSPSWEIEALKAQAVASRTYALYMINNPKHEDYDVERTTQDQVYGGVDAEDPRVQSAVRATQGEVLTFNQSPIKAFFHSRCGGSTETPRFVWNHGGVFPQQKVSCPYCIRFPFAWQTIVKAEELLRWTGLSLKTPFRIESGDRGSSGRLASLKLVSGNQRAVLGTDLLRSHVGYTKLKSTKFNWRQEGDEVSFHGVGNGHGVGMCQWGARYLAQQGKTYKEILAHYYPGALIQVLK